MLSFEPRIIITYGWVIGHYDAIISVKLFLVKQDVRLGMAVAGPVLCSEVNFNTSDVEPSDLYVKY